MYRVVMTYPDGSVEEIDEAFSTLGEAKDYAEKLLTQVGPNSRFKSIFDDDKGNVKPRYSIVSKKDGLSTIVFDSDK